MANRAAILLAGSRFGVDSTDKLPHVENVHARIFPLAYVEFWFILFVWDNDARRARERCNFSFSMI